MAHTINPRPEPRGVVRSMLTQNFTFGVIKENTGLGGLDMSRMAHLEQSSGSQPSASKSELLSAVDEQVREMDEGLFQRVPRP